MICLSKNNNGYVYLSDNKIIKIIPKLFQNEILFWQHIHITSYQKHLFIIPESITVLEIDKKNKSMYPEIPKGIYHLMIMSKKKGSVFQLIQQNNWSFTKEKVMLKQIIHILLILHKQGFVHADIHYANILYEGLQFYLIDFGLVLFPKIEMDSSKSQLYQIYLWSKDDIYSLLRIFFFLHQENHLIQNNDYKKHRSLWINFFRKHSNQWTIFKSIIEKTFELQQYQDFSYCFHFFINHILSDHHSLCPKPNIYLYDILTKVFLDRMFLLFSIWYPHIDNINCY
jgi:serine/threonine protein kinase